ncbi:hypothetical protein Taro_030162 [Colocasia esculenta]|uniref:Uncharacterized protein n=1 Tax=Colocasia esculenta TaxID=4460 RepID=A0A843VKR9_COLES|nr:hypothetical protein [Colocasia esculenta]
MVRFGARRVDPKWIISGRFSRRRKENLDPWSEEKRVETWAVPQSPPSIGAKGRVSPFLVPLPDRRQRRPSSFRSVTTTAIPSRSTMTVAILSRSTTTADILLPIWRKGTVLI